MDSIGVYPDQAKYEELIKLLFQDAAYDGETKKLAADIAILVSIPLPTRILLVARRFTCTDQQTAQCVYA